MALPIKIRGIDDGSTDAIENGPDVFFEHREIGLHRGFTGQLAEIIECFPADENAHIFSLPLKIEREQLLLGDLQELSVRILELCKERGRVTVSDIERVTGANRNTVKGHLAALTQKKHLERHGAGRGVWYSRA